MTTAIKTSRPESTRKAENAVINSQNGRRHEQNWAKTAREIGARCPKKMRNPSEFRNEIERFSLPCQRTGWKLRVRTNSKRVRILSLSPLPIGASMKPTTQIHRSESASIAYAPLAAFRDCSSQPAPRNTARAGSSDKNESAGASESHYIAAAAAASCIPGRSRPSPARPRRRRDG
jgi:hypothetical protein